MNAVPPFLTPAKERMRHMLPVYEAAANKRGMTLAAYIAEGRRLGKELREWHRTLRDLGWTTEDTPTTFLQRLNSRA